MWGGGGEGGGSQHAPLCPCRVTRMAHHVCGTYHLPPGRAYIFFPFFPFPFFSFRVTHTDALTLTAHHGFPNRALGRARLPCGEGMHDMYACIITQSYHSIPSLNQSTHPSIHPSISQSRTHSLTHSLNAHLLFYSTTYGMGLAIGMGWDGMGWMDGSDRLP